MVGNDGHRLGRAAKVAYIVTIVVSLLAWRTLPITKMVSEAYPLEAFAISFPLGLTAAMSFASISIDRKWLRVSSCVALVLCGLFLCGFSVYETFETILKVCHPNGDIGSAFAIAIERSTCGLAGIVLICCGVVAVANPGAPASEWRLGVSRTVVISLGVLVLMLGLPFVSAVYEEQIHRPATQDRLLEDYEAHNRYFVEELTERGLDYDYESLGYSGASQRLELDNGWQVTYEPELRYFEAHWYDKSVNLNVVEKGTCGQMILPAKSGGNGFWYLAPRINKATLDSILSLHSQRSTGGEGGVYDLEEFRWLSASEVAALVSEGDGLVPKSAPRGFGAVGACNGRSWDDPHGREWSLYLQGEGCSYASAYVMNDDHATVKKRFIVVEDTALIDATAVGAKVVEVERLDAQTLESLGPERESWLGA